MERYTVRHETWLEFKASTPYDDWAGIGATLGAIGAGHRWWIGDWLVFGEKAYGEKYSQAMEQTRLEYQTLANWSSVSRRVAPGTRRKELSWSHHEAVSKFELPGDQSRWLQKAIDNKWTKDELRKALKNDTPQADASGSADAGKAETAGETIRRVTLEQLTGWWEQKHAAGTLEALLDGERREREFKDLAREIAKACIKLGVRV